MYTENAVMFLCLNAVLKSTEHWISNIVYQHEKRGFCYVLLSFLCYLIAKQHPNVYLLLDKTNKHSVLGEFVRKNC